MTRLLFPDRSAEADRPEAVPRDPKESLQESLRRHGFLLNGWTVEPRGNAIHSEDQHRKVDPRLMDLLVHLAERPGEVVTREELLQAVWTGVFVNENTLSQAVSRLRRALGDDRLEPRYIETISRSGYRLIAPVELIAPIPSMPGPHPEPAEAPVAPLRGAAAPAQARPSARWLVWALPAVLVAALGGALLWLGPSTSPPSLPPVLIPELTLVGTQFDPVLSPDGAMLAFAWQGPGGDAGWNIWLHQVGGDNPVQLTEGAASHRLPSWSPDGSSIAYARFTDEECGIHRSPVLGGQSERIADCLPGMRSLDWSPDGDHLVISGRESPDASLRLVLHEIESGKQTPLTEPPPGSPGDRSPIFSPDGSLIAFSRNLTESHHDVMVVPVQGGAPRALTSDAWGQLRGVEWTADGAAVIFSSNRTGRFLLWAVPVAGGSPSRLPIEDSWVTQPSVARQGDRLIYRTFRDSVDLWSLPLDGEGRAVGEPVKRVASTRSERHPAWSPDGASIAFLSDRSGSTELWSGDADGTNLMRHTDLAGPHPASPAWSLDGARILFHAAVEDHADLWAVDRDSRAPVRLTWDDSEDRNGTFSRDGSRIYFASDRTGRWEVFRMPASGGTVEQVTEDGGFLAQESPDGRDLFFVKMDHPGVWRMPVEGGVVEEVIPDLGINDWGNWTVSDQGVFYVQHSPTRILLQPTAGGPPVVVHEPAKQMPYLGRALSIRADGGALLFSMIDHSDDEVMRAEPR